MCGWGVDSTFCDVYSSVRKNKGGQNAASFSPRIVQGGAPSTFEKREYPSNTGRGPLSPSSPRRPRPKESERTFKNERTVLSSQAGAAHGQKSSHISSCSGSALRSKQP